MTQRMQGKSWEIPHKLFNNWLVTKFNPLPESEIVMLMWQAWLESYVVMKQIRQLGKPHIPNCYVIEDELK